MVGPRAGARLRANTSGMRAHLPPAEAGGHLLVARRADGALAGVLVAARPGTWPFSPPRTSARLRCLLGQGPRVSRRWAAVSDAVRAEPVPPGHWYLATLGVDPSLWGRGVGSTLLAGWLARVDAAGGRAYLETDAPRNLAFYERAGFSVRREIRVLGVPVWILERPAVQGPSKE